MTPRSQNGFGVFFFLIFFRGTKGRFCFFGKIGVQNVVFCVVNRGGVVVKAWLETTANRAIENFPLS
jgi:hypothetical protein